MYYHNYMRTHYITAWYIITKERSHLHEHIADSSIVSSQNSTYRIYAQRALTVPSLVCAPFLARHPSQKGIPGSATRRKNREKTWFNRRQSSQRNARGRRGEGKKIPARIEEIGPTSCTRRQEKNSRMDTSSRTKSVERPVRAVDLFIASLERRPHFARRQLHAVCSDRQWRESNVAGLFRPAGLQNERRRIREARGGIRDSRERKRETLWEADEKKKRDRFNERVREKRQVGREVGRKRKRVDRPTGRFLEYFAQFEGKYME